MSCLFGFRHSVFALISVSAGICVSQKRVRQIDDPIQRLLVQLHKIIYITQVQEHGAEVSRHYTGVWTQRWYSPLCFTSSYHQLRTTTSNDGSLKDLRSLCSTVAATPTAWRWSSARSVRSLVLVLAEQQSSILYFILLLITKRWSQCFTVAPPGFSRVDGVRPNQFRLVSSGPSPHRRPLHSWQHRLDMQQLQTWSTAGRSHTQAQMLVLFWCSVVCLTRIRPIFWALHFNLNATELHLMFTAPLTGDKKLEDGVTYQQMQVSFSE